MERNKALEKVNKEFELYKDELQNQYTEAFHSNYDDMLTDIFSATKDVLSRKKARIIQYQVFRIDLHNQHCRITVSAYDDKWYLDENRQDSFVEAGFLWQPFEHLYMRMKKNISVYMGSISEYDLLNIFSEYFLQCFVNSVMKIRDDFALFDEWLLDNHLHMDKPYNILWGINKGENRTLFYQDRTGKSNEDLLPLLSEKNFFVSFVKGMLKKEKIEDKVFLYPNMKESNFSEMIFDRSVFAKAVFKRTKMEWCDYKGCRILYSDFTKIDGYQLKFYETEIDTVSFIESKLFRVGFKKARLSKVIFDHSDLQDVSFKGAELSDVSFRGCSLKEIDFTDTKMNRVYISPMQYKDIKLTREQADHVFVLEEDMNEILQAEAGSKS